MPLARRGPSMEIPGVEERGGRDGAWGSEGRRDGAWAPAQGLGEHWEVWSAEDVCEELCVSETGSQGISARVELGWY